jgi:hypothetical protein
LRLPWSPAGGCAATSATSMRTNAGTSAPRSSSVRPRRGSRRRWVDDRVLSAAFIDVGWSRSQPAIELVFPYETTLGTSARACHPGLRRT